MKPFKANVEFKIVRQSGGCWRFKLYLEAIEPKEDDIICINSSLNKTTSVSFKLTNILKFSAPFEANFSSESDPEFTVLPKKGQLEQYGFNGTNFIISFCPIEYGKTK